MPKSKERVRVVKGWAYIYKGKLVSVNLLDYPSSYCNVIPCEIRYRLGGKGKGGKK